jgi:hypothetical protein
MTKRATLTVRGGQEIEIVWNDTGHSADELNALVRKAGEPIGLVGYLKIFDKEKSYCDPLVDEPHVEELLQETLQKMKIMLRVNKNRSLS